MSARSDIADLLWLGVVAPTHEEAAAGAERMLDAYRAEVLNEAAEWLHSVGEREAAYLLRTCDVPKEEQP